MSAATGAGTATRRTTVGPLVVKEDAAVGPARGRALVVPPFGISADSLFLPAYVLAQNGFDVVRFDPRDHVGDSPGVIRDYRMSQVVQDVHAMVDASRPDLVVGFSLAAPAVFRVLAERAAPLPALLAAPVVSMRRTLRAVLDVDYFGPATPGDRQVVLGQEIDGPRFVDDCTASRIVELDDSLADLARVRGPVVMVSGTDDPWVDFAEVRRVEEHRRLAGAGPTEVVPVAVGTHQFNLNPQVARTYTEVLLAAALRMAGADPAQGRTPPLAEIIAARRRAAAPEQDGARR